MKTFLSLPCRLVSKNCEIIFVNFIIFSLVVVLDYFIFKSDLSKIFWLNKV